MAGHSWIWRRGHGFGHTILWAAWLDLAVVGQVQLPLARANCPPARFGWGTAKSIPRRLDLTATVFFLKKNAPPDRAVVD